MSFTSLDLHPPILKALNLCGYNTPTPVQAQSIPVILEGKDIVASAQTGTGKTAAFVLPALHHLCLHQAHKKTSILILTPTRELANQITTAARTYGKFLRFNIVNLVGGMPYPQQIRELAHGADIIVATPGRLLDHMEKKRVDLSHLKMLVLDEADRMLDMGFIEDVEYIAACSPKQRQTLLFSATVDKKLTQVVKHLLNDPVRVDLSDKRLTVPAIKQEMYRASNPQHKRKLLNRFLNDNQIFKAIIFSATKINADRLADQLTDDGFAAAALHGDLRQHARNRTLDKFRRGKIQFLVATDVAARGIDIHDITHVINYDLPRSCEDYVHRIGRTGRAGREGMAISFVLPSDMRHLQSIERYIGQRFKLVNLGGEPEGHSHTPHHERPEGQKRSHRKSEEHTYRRSDEKPHHRKKSAQAPRDNRYHASDDEQRPSRRFKADGEQRPGRRFKADGEERPGRRFKADGEERPGRRFKADGEQRPGRRFKADGEERPGRRFKADGEQRPGRRFKFEGEKRAPHFRKSDDESSTSRHKKSASRKTKSQFDDRKKHKDRDFQGGFKKRGFAKKGGKSFAAKTG